MKAILLAVVSSVGAAAAIGQAPPAQNAAATPALKTGPGVQAPQDAKYADYRAANCKNLPAQAAGGPGGGRRGAAGNAPPTNPDGSPMHREYMVAAIPGVVAAGQTWKTVWKGRGNNADGPVATSDGGIMVAQNTDSKIMKLDRNNNVSFPYENLRTAGSVTVNKKNQVFVLERGLPQDILQLAPKRQILADKILGEPIDCAGGLLNDMTADGKGGVYFTKAGVHYANAKGEITKYGTIGGNGIILSPDEKTLYVTGRLGGAAAGGGPGANGGLVAFDVQADGSLTNERQFSTCPCGDGSAVDASGRIFSTGGGGVQVIDKDGKLLGEIPTPLNFISVAFGGPDKKTLYGIANNQQYDEIFTLQLLAQGYKGRAK
jgi:gluconolactonase